MTRGSSADLLGRALGDLLAVVEDRDPVADPHHQLHVVLDQQDREAEVPAQPRDQRDDLRRLLAGSCRPPARRAAGASGRCASARAISSRRWSPYGRFLAASLPLPAQPDELEQLLGPLLGGLLLAAPGGVLNSASGRLARSCVCIPTSMFSSAVMFWNSRMFWNVRPTPAATMSLGRALRKIPNRSQLLLVPDRPDDREQERCHEEHQSANPASASRRPADDVERAEDGREPARRRPPAAPTRATRTRSARAGRSSVAPGSRPRPTSGR